MDGNRPVAEVGSATSTGGMFPSTAGISVDNDFDDPSSPEYRQSDPPDLTEIRPPISASLAGDTLTEHRSSIQTCAAAMADECVSHGGGDIVELLMRPYAKTVF
jgi:hypothetical protein